MQIINIFNCKKKILENKQIKQKKLIVDHLSNNKLFNKKKKLKSNFLTFILKIIIILLIVYILILLTKLKKSEYLRRLYKIFRANLDINLFLKNKTQFYYINRKKSLKINYNESNLKTFQEKMNYLIIHESPEYKLNIADKIKLYK